MPAAFALLHNAGLVCPTWLLDRPAVESDVSYGLSAVEAVGASPIKILQSPPDGHPVPLGALIRATPP